MAQLKEIPLSVIEGAVNGEIDALKYVLAHFRNYIRALATRKVYDDYGNERYYVDEDIVMRLENKLVYGIINSFKIRY